MVFWAISVLIYFWSHTDTCHGPDLQGKKSNIVCRGGRDFQLQIWHRMGMIDEPTDEALEKNMVALGLWE